VRSRSRAVLLALLGATLLPLATHAQRRPPLERIRLPPGFSIELFAEVPNARAMALGARTLFVGSRSGGKVHAVRLRGEGAALSAGRVTAIAQNLDMPTGVAFRDGSLYVADVSRILRFDGIEGLLDAPSVPTVVTNRLPQDTHHGWKFIAFGPDGQLYVPVGGPCNACERDPERYALIHRMLPDGSKQEVFARGIRNTVGFDWHPETKELWFTDNGRDWLGDDLPADELNHAPRASMHFGFPYCHQGDLPDPEYGRERKCSEFTPPAQKLGAHVAPLGMRFYRGGQFPPEYRNQIFIAEHGSWNRSKKSGYRVSIVRVEGGRAVSYEAFAEGWLEGDTAWGRPVDLLELPDGSMLVSDDHAGMIYRIRYTK
jgi:glucose/arabinose dehydrogenase